jgi:hypothetical protein
MDSSAAERPTDLGSDGGCPCVPNAVSLHSRAGHVHPIDVEMLGPPTWCDLLLSSDPVDSQRAEQSCWILFEAVVMGLHFRSCPV